MPPKNPTHFGAPDITDHQDQFKMLKTSQRVAANMVKYGVCDDPIEIEPDCIGADRQNRGGATPNITVCRENIGASFKKDGCDKSKPQIGIVKDYSKHPEMLAQLVKHNQEFGMGDPRWPPVFPDKMKNGSLAATHLTITLRCYKHSLMAPWGETFTVGTCPALQRFTEFGHKYWKLTCEIPDADALEISEWRNTDNNCNQVKHEIEHIKGLQRVAKKEIELAGKACVLSLTTVLAKFTTQAQLRLVQQSMLDLTRFVVDMRAGEEVDEICNFHSQHVNPNDLSVPSYLFGEATRNIKRTCPKVKTAIIIEAYDSDHVVQKVRRGFVVVDVFISYCVSLDFEEAAI